MDLDNPSYFSMGCEESLDLLLPDFSPRIVPTTSEGYDDASTSSNHSLPRNRKHFYKSSSTSEELIILGEPRLSDIAPDLVKKTEPTRTNSLKHRKNFEDLMYFQPGHQEEDEVFFAKDSVRYYNVSKPRRHSISTFMKQTSPSSSLTKSIRSESVSSKQKKCIQCMKKSGKVSTMDDILILSVKQSDAATLWVEYFTNYFEHICTHVNRRPFKIYHLGVEEVLEANLDLNNLKERTCNVKLQMVILCPSFIEEITTNPIAARGLGKLIQQDRVLALLLGVNDEDVNDICRQALLTYPQWQRHNVGIDQDENFAKEFLKSAVGIFSNIWKKQTNFIQQKTTFSVLPKKIRQGHNVIIITLTDPLETEDVVTVSVERNNEIQEIKNVKKRNPYTLKLTIPENYTEVSAIVNVLVEKNGSLIGSRPIKCESRLRELEQILRSIDNPMEFMCQSLGFNPFNIEHLDDCLLYSFQRNLPPNFAIFNGQKPNGTNLYCHSQEYPTLLHFAARYGLEKLAMQLLECPGGDIACEIQNSCDLTPSEMAQNAGHVGLAQTLSGYMKMNEVKSAYEKLKEMSLQSKTPDSLLDEDKGYLIPNPYKKCPKPTKLPPSTSEGCYYMSMQSPNKPPQNRVIKPPDTLNVTISPPSFKPKECTKTPPIVIEDKVQRELAEIINDFKNNVHSITQVEKLVDEWKNRNDVQKSFKEKQEQLNEMRARYEKIQQEMKSAMKKPTPFERLKKVFTKNKPKTEIVRVQIETPPNSINRPISSLSIQSDSSSASSGRVSTISGCSMGDSGTHSDHEDRKHAITNHDENFDNELKKAIMNLNYMIPPPPRPVTLTKFSNLHKQFPIIEEKPVEKTEEAYYIQFPPSGLPVPAKILNANEKMKTKESSIYLDLATNLQQKPKSTLEYMNLQTEFVHEYMNSVHMPLNT